MRIKINTSTYSISKRMMSAFLAFLIVVLTFQQAVVNMSIMVKAAGIPVLTPNLTNGKITSSSNQISSLMGQTSGTGAVRDSHASNGTTVNGTYTGRIRPVTVNMYDYLTDNEIKYGHLGGENTSGDAQLYDANYTWYNRYDPYSIRK